MRGMCWKAAGLERKAGQHLGGFERLEKADGGLVTRGEGRGGCIESGSGGRSGHT